jgi:methyl-accepting chemotaxis protein
VAISGEVAKALRGITETAEKVNTFVAEIASASAEQSTGITQVTAAMGQIDKTTQSNAAGAEESAAASQELAAQAQQLQSLVLDLGTLVGSAAPNHARRPM